MHMPKNAILLPFYFSKVNFMLGWREFRKVKNSSVSFSQASEQTDDVINITKFVLFA